MLLADEEKFEGWKIEQGQVEALHCCVVTCCHVYSVTYKDKHNQSILDAVVKEVKCLNTTFLTEHIKGRYLIAI